MPAPARPQDVFDREREWKELARVCDSPRPELVIALGRRRVGKSATLAPFAEAVRGLYYQATRQTEAEQLRALSELVGRRFSDAALESGATFPSWDALWAYLSKHAGDGLLVVIDEFPYLAEAAPALTSVLQRFVDHELRDSRLKLVLSGSHITAMQALSAADQPLYSRRTRRIEFAPFDYLDAARFVPNYTPRDRMRAWAIFGGLPGHLSLLDPDLDLAANLCRHILDPGGRLFDEAQHMLDAFLSDGRIHYSVLEAIAGGQETWAGICSRIGVSGGSVSRPMQWLIDMQLVRRDVPVTEPDPQRTKRSLYRLADPYIRFWHRFVAPLIASGVASYVPAERLYERHVASGLDDFMGLPFEELVGDFARRPGTLPFEPVRIGRWWSRTGSDEVDLVALGAAGEVLAVECKWGAVDAHDLSRLRARAAGILADLERPGRLFLAIASPAPPEDPAVGAAVKAGELVCWTADDLYGLLQLSSTS